MPVARIYASGRHPGRRGSGRPPNKFSFAKCDARFISSSSQEAIKNNVQVSELE